MSDCHASSAPQKSAQEERSVWQKLRGPAVSLVLLTIAIGMTWFLFAPVVLVDNGSLVHAGDDAGLFLQMVTARSVADVFRAHADHLVPVTLGIYWVCAHLFGADWVPYGAMLMIVHGLLAWLIGEYVRKVTGSWTAAFVVGVLFLSCVPMAAGPTFGFVHVVHYLCNALLCVALLALHRRWKLESRVPALVVVLLCAFIAPFVHATGLLTIAEIGMAATCYSLALCVQKCDRPLWRRPDWPVLAGLCAVAVVAMGAYAAGVRWLDNPIPGTTNVGGGAPPPFVASKVSRAVDLLDYASTGLVFPNYSADYGGDLLVVPYHAEPIHDSRPLFVGMASIIAWLAIAPFVWRKASPHRELAIHLAAALFASGIVAYAVVAGREVISFWMSRYGMYVVLWTAIVAGLGISMTGRFVVLLSPTWSRWIARLFSVIVILSTFFLVKFANQSFENTLREFSEMRRELLPRPYIDWQEQMKARGSSR